MTRVARVRGGVLREALIVGVLGVAGGFGANALRDEGLELGRDYFFQVRPAAAPARDAGPSPGSTGTAPGTLSPGGPDAMPTESAPDGPDAAPAEPFVEALDPAVLARLAGQGLQVLTHAEAVATWRDPAHALGLFVFIDARSDSFYAEGHVPGAWQFDHYHQDRFLPAVLPVVTDPQVARVVVYCRGGDCEDSELAAMNLMVRGVSPEKLFIYASGWEAWKAAGMPVETGARRPPEPPGP